jgi:hypothetical protein
LLKVSIEIAVSKCMNQSINKRDFINLAILLAVTVGIGIYLILTTILISKDGVLYIELAQQMATSPMGVIKNHPFGYPFLIFLTHKIVTLFSNSSSIYTWIYSAQCVNLFCRILALVPLYFIGKLLVGSYHSFWGLLVLVFLPYPSKFGSDALRDWPHILFLSCGFLIILWAAKGRKWMHFFLVGLLSGLGYLIRPVCAQLVLYSLLWLGYCFIRPLGMLSRKRAVAAVILLLLGFLIPAGPDMKIKGAVIPPVLRGLVSIADLDEYPVQDEKQNLFCVGISDVCKADSSGRFKTFYEIFKNLGENLLWIFVVPWFVGVFCYFQLAQTRKEKYIMSVFIVLNVIFLILRSTGIEGDVSKRYILPLICFTCFYISMGLVVLICLITKERHSSIDFVPVKRTWFYVLVVIGLGICAPKLFKPIGSDKEFYRSVAGWLNKNTPENAAIAVTDKRISFYAKRRGLVYDEGIPQQARYVVKIFGGKKEIPIEEEMQEAKEVFSVKGDGKKANIVIYDFGNSISESVSFISYCCEKIADEKYRFSFLFEVKDGFEEDLAIYFHGSVQDENVILLPVNRRKFKFDNWDFYPELPTSAWPKNDYVTVSREISAKPIPYNFNLGFYSVDTGLHGRGINLGWIDLGDTKFSDIGE